MSTWRVLSTWQGDSILSIDDVVPTSPKHAVQLIMSAEYVVKFVVIGNDPASHTKDPASVAA